METYARLLETRERRYEWLKNYCWLPELRVAEALRMRAEVGQQQNDEDD